MIEIDSITVSMKYEKEIIRDLIIGISGKEIAEKFGVYPSHVSNVKKKHFKDGVRIQAAEPKKVGRKGLDYDVKRVQVRFPVELFDRVEKAAGDAGKKPTEFIIDLCEREV